MLALGGKVAQHVGHPVVGVSRLHVPGRFEPLPERRVFQPGFPAEKPEAQAQVGRGNGKFLADHLFQAGKIRGRARDGLDAGFFYHPHQLGGVSHPKRKDGGAGGLQVGVVGVSAHPQTVVEAVDHPVVGPQARGPEGPGAAVVGEGEVFGGQGGVDEPAGGSGRAVHPADLFVGGRAKIPEGRTALLGDAKFRFRGKRQPGKVLWRPDLSRIDPRVLEFLPVKIAASGHVGKLPRQKFPLHGRLSAGDSASISSLKRGFIDTPFRRYVVCGAWYVARAMGSRFQIQGSRFQVEAMRAAWSIAHRA